MTTNNKTNNAISSNGYQYNTFILTPSQVTGMFAAPVDLIGSPGANKAIWIIDSHVGVIFNSAAYTGGGVISFIYTTSGAAASLTTAASTINSASSNCVEVSNVVSLRTLANISDQGLSIKNITGAFATGDSNVRVVLWWSVIDTV